MSRDRVTLAGICLAVAALPVYAEQATADNAVTQQLETVNVTGKKIKPKTIDEQPGVTVIDRKQLDEKNATGLASVLANEPGVSVMSNGNKTGAYGVNIRGVDMDRILMTVDDERLLDSYRGNPLSTTAAQGGKDYIEPDTLKQVDIVKGPASALYGSGALGGSVRYRSYDPTDFVGPEVKQYLGLKGGYTSVNKGKSATATLAASGDEVAGMLMLTKREASETKTFGSNDVIGSKRTTADPQTSDGYNVLAKLKAGLTGPHHLTFTAEEFSRKRVTDELETSATAKFREKTVRDRVGVDYNYSGNGGLMTGANAKVYYQALRYGYREFTGTSTNTDNLSQTIVGLSGDTTWQLGGHTLKTGTELTQTKSNQTVSDGNYFAPTTAYDLGLYAQDSFKLGIFSISPTLRYDFYRKTPDTSTSSYGVAYHNYTANLFSPKLQIDWPMGNAWSGYTAFNTGFRTAPLEADYGYKYTAYRTQIIANPDLKPETSRGVEMGAKYLQGNVEAQISAFYTRYHNFMELANLGTVGGYSTYQYTNVSQAQVRGAEAKAGWQVSPEVRLTGSIAYASGEDLTRHTGLYSVAPLTTRFGAEYKQDRWGSNVLWTIVKAKSSASMVGGASNGSNSSIAYLPPGYGKLDVGGWYKLGKATTLRAGIDNLTDKKYWNWSDIEALGTSYATVIDRYTAARRSFNVSIETSF